MTEITERLSASNVKTPGVVLLDGYDIAKNLQWVEPKTGRFCIYDDSLHGKDDTFEYLAGESAPDPCVVVEFKTPERPEWHVPDVVPTMKAGVEHRVKTHRRKVDPGRLDCSQLVRRAA